MTWGVGSWRLSVAAATVLNVTLACGAAEAARCDALITPEELKSLGRDNTLIKADESRGSSICMWEGAAENSGGFILTLQTAEWFKFEQASGARESFDRRRQGYDAAVGTEAIPNLGLEARITRHERAPTVMIRRSDDNVYLMCTDCSRDQSIALAKLAAAP